MIIYLIYAYLNIKSHLLDVLMDYPKSFMYLLTNILAINNVEFISKNDKESVEIHERYQSRQIFFK